MQKIDFTPALSPVSSNSYGTLVNTEWAGSGLDQKAVLVPGAMQDGKSISLKDFEAGEAVPKHHKSAEQRARQLARTQYTKSK